MIAVGAPQRSVFFLGMNPQNSPAMNPYRCPRMSAFSPRPKNTAREAAPQRGASFFARCHLGLCAGVGFFKGVLFLLFFNE